MKIFILLGPPGAGKGTYAKPLCKEYGFEQYSTGQVFRDEMAANSELGQKVKGYLESGSLVPDEIVVEVAANYLKTKKDEGCNGVLLDGFPRTVPQAVALDETLDTLGLPLTGTVLLDADRELIITRLTGRRVCKSCDATYHVINIPPKVEGICDNCGSELHQRKDDSSETVINRLDIYDEQTAPLIAYYESKGLLGRTLMSGDIDDDYRQILEAMSL